MAFRVGSRSQKSWCNSIARHALLRQPIRKMMCGCRCERRDTNNFVGLLQTRWLLLFWFLPTAFLWRLPLWEKHQCVLATSDISYFTQLTTEWTPMRVCAERIPLGTRFDGALFHYWLCMLSSNQQNEGTPWYSSSRIKQPLIIVNFCYFVRKELK